MKTINVYITEPSKLRVEETTTGYVSIKQPEGYIGSITFSMENVPDLIEVLTKMNAAYVNEL